MLEIIEAILPYTLVLIMLSVYLFIMPFYIKKVGEKIRLVFVLILLSFVAGFYVNSLMENYLDRSFFLNSINVLIVLIFLYGIIFNFQKVIKQ